MLKVASFFAGVGGVDLGFEKAGFNTIYANEFDDYAADTFELNFGIDVDRRDINDISVDSIPVASQDGRYRKQSGRPTKISRQQRRED